MEGSGYYMLIFIFKVIYCQHFIGDPCVLQATGESGHCHLIDNCPAAVHYLYSAQVYPQNCGFQDEKPIVCCIGNTAPVRPHLVTERPIPGLSEISTDVGKKSREKCQEYGKFEYSVSSPLALPGVQLTEPCPFPSFELMSQYTVSPKEFPHMAAIGFDDKENHKVWKCSGSLISERFVLTAAHCLHHQLYGEPKYIRLGDLLLGNDTEDANPQEFTIVERITHPNYKPPSQYNDIALLKMDREVQFNAYIKPACLNINETLTTRLAVVSGFDEVNFSQTSRLALSKASFRYNGYAECNNSYGSVANLEHGITERYHICAGLQDESCQGDSGGPLQIYNGNEVDCTYKILGVTSIPKPCNGENVPGVFTKVSEYIGWLESIAWP